MNVFLEEEITFSPTFVITKRKRRKQRDYCVVQTLRKQIVSECSFLWVLKHSNAIESPNEINKRRSNFFRKKSLKKIAPVSKQFAFAAFVLLNDRLRTENGGIPYFDRRIVCYYQCWYTLNTHKRSSKCINSVNVKFFCAKGQRNEI